MARYIPKRGDIMWMSLDPVAGHEQAGVRPVVVVSPVHFNRSTGLAYVVPVTSKRKGYPTELPIDGIRIHGMALASSLRSIDWRERKPTFAEVCPPSALKKIQGMIMTILSEPE